MRARSSIATAWKRHAAAQHDLARLPRPSRRSRIRRERGWRRPGPCVPSQRFGPLSGGSTQGAEVFGPTRLAPARSREGKGPRRQADHARDHSAQRPPGVMLGRARDVSEERGKAAERDRVVHDPDHEQHQAHEEQNDRECPKARRRRPAYVAAPLAWTVSPFGHRSLDLARTTLAQGSLNDNLSVASAPSDW